MNSRTRRLLSVWIAGLLIETLIVLTTLGRIGRGPFPNFAVRDALRERRQLEAFQKRHPQQTHDSVRSVIFTPAQSAISRELGTGDIVPLLAIPIYLLVVTYQAASRRQREMGLHEEPTPTD